MLVFLSLSLSCSVSHHFSLFLSYHPRLKLITHLPCPASSPPSLLITFSLSSFVPRLMTTHWFQVWVSLSLDLLVVSLSVSFSISWTSLIFSLSVSFSPHCLYVSLPVYISLYLSILLSLCVLAGTQVSLQTPELEEGRTRPNWAELNSLFISLLTFISLVWPLLGWTLYSLSFIKIKVLDRRPLGPSVRPGLYFIFFHFCLCWAEFELGLTWSIDAQAGPWQLDPLSSIRVFPLMFLWVLASGPNPDPHSSFPPLHA